MKILSSSHPRTAIIKKNIIASFGIRILSVAVSLLLVPLTIGYISSELYGVWLTLSSVIGWIGFFDIGFGNGLKNKLAVAIAHGKFDEGKSYVSTTYAFLSVIFLFAGGILYVVVPYINWSSFLNVSAALNEQLVDVVRVILVFFILQMVLKIVSTVMLAYQETAKSSLIDTLGQILCLGAIFVLTKTAFPSLTYLAFALSASPVIVLLFSSFILYNFSEKYKRIAPDFKSVKFKYAKDILSLGGNFFIIQIAVLVLYQTTNIIISKVAGPEAVTTYNVVYKYLSVSLMVFNIIMSPMWAAFTDAYAKSDFKWMNNIYSKLLKLYFFTLAILCAMLIISPVVYKLWLGDKVTVPLSMTFIVVVYMGCSIWNSFHSFIINGIGKIRLQLYLSLVATVFNIPLAFVLGNLWGAHGVILSMIIFSILPAIFLSIQTKKILNGNAAGLWNK